MAWQIVVCGSLAPDPLQNLTPQLNPPGLAHEALLPMILDPFAAHALYEAANLAKTAGNGSKVYLVSLGPKAKLQQLMMNVAQKVPFELVAVNCAASLLAEPNLVAAELAKAIKNIPDFDLNKLILFGGQASATRDAGIVLPLVAQHLGISEQFFKVDFCQAKDATPGAEVFTIKERLAKGAYQVAEVKGLPFACTWATGNLPTPPNNPQIGMQNMRQIMPALMKALPVSLDAASPIQDLVLPTTKRQAKVVQDMPLETMAEEIATWLKENNK